MLEAGALSHGRDVVDIYSNSWGPFDEGFRVAQDYDKTCPTRWNKHGIYEVIFCQHACSFSEQATHPALYWSLG